MSQNKNTAFDYFFAFKAVSGAADYLTKWFSLTKPIDRPDWNQYFMSMAFLASTRSPDAETKHGCVIVDKAKRVLGIGYNGFPHGMPDHLIPNMRPSKYLFVTHSERNALANCTMRPEGGAAYITGEPCIECLKAMYQEGIKELYLAKRHGSFKISDEERAAFNTIVEFGNIKITHIEPDFSILKKLVD